MQPIDTLRGIFLEADPLYPGAGFYAKTHVQIVVRSPTCIKSRILRHARTNVNALKCFQCHNPFTFSAAAWPVPKPLGSLRGAGFGSRYMKCVPTVPPRRIGRTAWLNSCAATR